MIYECDLESERSLGFDSTYLIYTKNTNKFWKIYNGGFIEILKENVQATLGRSGIVNFVNEKIKTVSFGITYIGIPKVGLTLDADGNIPYKTLATSTGFTINFKTNYNGNVEWNTSKI